MTDAVLSQIKQRRVRVIDPRRLPRVIALLRKLEARSVGSWDELDRFILAELRKAIESDCGAASIRAAGGTPQ